MLGRVFHQTGDWRNHLFKLLAIALVGIVDPCLAELIECDVDACQFLPDVLPEDGETGRELFDLIGVGVDV